MDGKIKIQKNKKKLRLIVTISWGSGIGQVMKNNENFRCRGYSKSD